MWSFVIPVFILLLMTAFVCVVLFRALDKTSGKYDRKYVWNNFDLKEKDMNL